MTILRKCHEERTDYIVESKLVERGRVGGGWDGLGSGRCNRRVGLAEQGCDG